MTKNHPQLQTHFGLMQLAIVVLQWKEDGAQERLEDTKLCT